MWVSIIANINVVFIIVYAEHSSNFGMGKTIYSSNRAYNNNKFISTISTVNIQIQLNLEHQ